MSLIKKEDIQKAALKSGCNESKLKPFKVIRVKKNRALKTTSQNLGRYDNVRLSMD